jgi:hypothetical protein
VMSGVALISNVDARRAKSGRFLARRNPLALYEIVHEVAIVAARRDDQSRKDPRLVAQAAFNSARRALEPVYGSIPQAHEICRQLSDRSGLPFPWRELLDLVFDDSRDNKRVHEERLSEPDRPLSERHVVVALIRIAYHLGRETLLPHEYDEGRQTLLAAASSRAQRELLARQLPTRGQIEQYCGRDWDRALAIAGLSPRPAAEPPRAAGLPLIEAIVLFYAGHGYLPTSAELEDNARESGHSLESRKGRVWRDYIDAAQDEIAERGMPTPPAYGMKVASEGWPAVEVNFTDAPKRRQRRYDHIQVLEAVGRFVAALGSQSPTHSRYRSFARQTSAPSLKVIVAHGGLDELVAEVGRSGWQDRAESWVDPRLPHEDERMAIARERIAARALTPRAEAVAEVIKRRGETTAQVIADELGWKITKVRDCLSVLKAAGRIVATQEFAQSRKQTYRLVIDGEGS